MLALDRQRRGALCRGGVERWAEVWNPASRAALQSTFRASERPFAARAFELVDSSLESYGDAWTAEHEAACVATRIHGVQSEDLLDRRMMCLDGRLEEVNALKDLLVEADGERVDRAAESIQGLLPPEVCSDLDALTARVAPPTDPADRRRLQEARRELSRAAALGDSASYDEALEIAEGLLPAIVDLGYPPLEAEAHLLLGELLETTQDFPRSDEHLLQALFAAHAGRDHRLAARAADRLPSVVSYHQVRYDEAPLWQGLAEASVQALGGDPLITAETLSILAKLSYSRSEYDRALLAQVEAVGILEKGLGPDDLRLADGLRSLGLFQTMLARYDEARESYGRALDLQRRMRGPDHPAVAKTLLGLSAVEAYEGNLQAAYEAESRAVEIFEGVFGPHHLSVSQALGQLGITLHDLGRNEEANDVLRRALAIAEKELGRAHPTVMRILSNLAANRGTQKRWQEALELNREALEVGLELFGGDHYEVAIIRLNIGETLRELGRPREALEAHQRMYSASLKNLGPEHPFVAEAMMALGQTYLAAGETRQGLDLLAKAVATYESTGTDDETLAQARFVRAQALWNSGVDRPGALAEAKQAQGLLDGNESSGFVDRAEVGAWIAEREGS